MINTDDLKRQVLFENLGQAELQKLTGIVKELALKKGDSLFKESDETTGIYLIRSGKIEISKVTPDGWKQTLAALTPGQFFGELSIIEKRRHEARAEAMDNTDMFLLSKADFEKMEKENQMLALGIMKKIALVMSKNLRRMNDKFMNALINY